MSGGKLYGTTSFAGADSGGTVFAINTDGSGFTNVHAFLYDNNFNLSAGGNPRGSLTPSGSMLYGTASDGGTSGWGAIFSVNTDGTGYAVLYNFTGGADGALPSGSVILSGGMLYGTASARGGQQAGTVFAVNAAGGGLTNLHSFSSLGDFSTNNDGASLNNDLVLVGSALYGTTQQGGTNGSGVIFSVNTNGTGFTLLHTFTAVNSSMNGDGAEPFSGLVLSGGTLYGSTFHGGSEGLGIIFAINPDGSGFTNLHNFSLSDGHGQNADLIVAGGKLYGTTIDGGTFGSGSVFSVNTDGTGSRIFITSRRPVRRTATGRGRRRDCGYRGMFSTGGRVLAARAVRGHYLR